MAVDVVIVGGGVVGLAVADQLARDGCRVTLVERGACGHEASWAGAGIIEPCSWHRTDDLARIHTDAVLAFEDFAVSIRERSGIDPQFMRCGALRLIRDDNRMKMARREVEVVGDRLTPEGEAIVSTLTPEQARALEPHLITDMLGAQLCRLSAQVRNPRLVQGLQRCCELGGVTIKAATAVVGLLKNGSRVIGVRTQHEDIEAAKTIICAGAWSSQIDPALEQHIPVYPVRGQMLLLRMAPSPLKRIVMEGNFYLVPRLDGHILVGSTEEHDAGFNARTNVQGIAGLSAQALEFVGALAGASIAQSWAGLRPGTLDRRPYMGPIPDLDNCLACTGHFRTGLTTAPIVASLMSDLVRTGFCAYDLQRCLPGRQPASNAIRAETVRD
jgi:glycine oxidase